jgi:hypothetical protein
MTLGRCLEDYHLVELPLTSKRRSPARRLAHACEPIHESSQVHIYRAKGFSAIAGRPLPSRISYRYSDLEISYALTTGEPSHWPSMDWATNGIVPAHLHGTSSNT